MMPASIERTSADFERMYANLAGDLLHQTPFNRGRVHAQEVTDESMHTIELNHVHLQVQVPKGWLEWQEMVKPNLPWAEDHFMERTSGEPLNPPPSEAWWPFAQSGNSIHKKEEKFSHTYPERFWPKRAGLPDDSCPDPEHCTVEEHRDHWGIRFKYGDLDDLLIILRGDPLSRQAYLPIWFPEDLTAARDGERVPCTLGYHFMVNAQNHLDCFYPMRSCDLVRFFRDDVYMAGRLMQHIGMNIGRAPGRLVMQISNLHAFIGDKPFLKSTVEAKPVFDKRSGYNWQALG